MTEMSILSSLGQDWILNEVRTVDQAINKIEDDLERLKNLRSRNIAGVDVSSTSATRQEIDRVSDSILVKYRGLVGRVKNITSDPESGYPRNAAQLNRVSRRLKVAISQYQQVNFDYRKNSQAQTIRQYMIIQPDATEAEVREVVEDNDNQQVFSQILLQSDRRGNARYLAQNSRGRHKDIQKIEQNTAILAQLFLDLEALVMQQEPAVTVIEQDVNQINDHVQAANTELNAAAKKARAARRKKFYCLGICGELLLRIAIF